jgi:hypothetical protein
MAPVLAAGETDLGRSELQVAVTLGGEKDGFCGVHGSMVRSLSQLPASGGRPIRAVSAAP